jgi:hypothetical protein
MKVVEWVLRIGTFGTFLGHGLWALSGKSTWLGYLMFLGIDNDQARILLPIIGSVDCVVASWILLKPNKWVVLWAVFWAFSTATIRPLSGEPILEFVERAANWAVPLALYFCRFHNFSRSKEFN